MKHDNMSLRIKIRIIIVYYCHNVHLCEFFLVHFLFVDTVKKWKQIDLFIVYAWPIQTLKFVSMFGISRSLVEYYVWLFFFFTSFAPQCVYWTQHTHLIRNSHVVNIQHTFLSNVYTWAYRVYLGVGTLCLAFIR